MRKAVAILATLIVGLFAAVAALPAGAQDDGGGQEGPETFVRSVDSTDNENVEMGLVYAGDDVGSVQVSSDGSDLNTGEPTRYIDTNRVACLAIVVDTNGAMNDNGGLDAARRGIGALAQAKPENLEMAVVAAGDTPRTLTPCTRNVERITSAAEDLAPSPDQTGATWGAVNLAVNLLEDDPDVQPNLMVITSGGDAVTADQQGSAIARAAASGAVSWTLGIGGFDTAAFELLREETGGTINAYGRAGELEEGISTVGGWVTETQYIVPFVGPEPETDGDGEPVTTVEDITVTVGDESVDVSYTSGRNSQTRNELEPAGGGGTAGLPVLNTSLGLYLGIALAMVAIATFVYAIVLLVTRDEGALSSVLQPYADGFAGTEEAVEEEGGGIGQSALIQRAVEMTEQVADAQGYLSRTEAALERADLPLRAGEALAAYVGIVVALTIAVLLLSQNLLVGLVIGLIVALIPPAFVNFRAGRRRSQFQQQLPDTLQLLAGTLRAGYSLMQGVEAVSQEVEDPMGKELRRVVTEARLGRQLEESLDSMAERMASPDFAWAVMAIRIQREVGGNLSELLMTVSDTMIARERLRRDIAALTAEGRISALVLGLLPVGLGAVMFLINPDYIGRLFETTLGNVLLVMAAIGMGIGFAWMRQIIKIEI